MLNYTYVNTLVGNNKQCAYTCANLHMLGEYRLIKASMFWMKIQL